MYQRCYHYHLTQPQLKGNTCVLSSLSESAEVVASMLLVAKEDDDKEEELDDADDDDDDDGDEDDDTQIVEPWYPFPFTCSQKHDRWLTWAALLMM